MRKLAHGFLFIIQYCFYWILCPVAKLFYGNKRIWIISERGDDARDNGYWMFKHLSTEHSYVNQYYLIDKKSVDYKKVKNLGKVVKYKSFKHWLLYCAAEVRMTTHLAAFAPGNFIGEYFKHHKQKGVNVFLQHGITHNEFPSNYFEHNGSDLFICGAKPEFNHISTNCGYPGSNVVYTGFARFDGLHEFEVKKQILIMPSWRSYLSDASIEDFINSQYFKEWSRVLENKDLIEYCKVNSIKVIFYPHYEMQKFISCFSKLENDVISIANFDNYDVQTLLKESALLITDYSSILFDFAYMRKPQILYQFDKEDFYGKHYQHSYFDHGKDGFGDVVFGENELVSKIKSFGSEFTLSELFLSNINMFFPIFDDLNCERIYQEIVRKFISKKKQHKFVDELNVVLTGDDYGRNFESSEGIRQAFKKDFIQHASIILNKDERDNLDLVNIDKSKFGLHINLTEGFASYGDTSIYAYSVNDQNSISKKEFNTRRAYYKMSENAKEVIRQEVAAQAKKYKELGFENLVFDSHGHIHNKLPIAKEIIPVMKGDSFTFVRRPSNLSKTKLLQKMYKHKIYKLYKKNFNTYEYFGSCDDFIHLKHYRKFKGKTIEIMTHPFINKYGKLVNRRDIDFSLLYKEKCND